VRTIDIDLQSNVVTIGPATDREFDLESIPSAIRDAGFRPSDMHVRAHGAFDASRSDCFRIRGWSRCYPVRGTTGTTPSGEITLEADVAFGEEPGNLLLIRAASP
jgi:hypothetical protein